ncbi:MAG TPA: hypothetical protein VFT00_04920, partial [Nocardioides sp.]|nr:hypothetical protein [Nocardioides sp.]
VKFVTPKPGDAVAVVARSVEAKDEEVPESAEDEATGASTGDVPESSDEATDATIDETAPETTGSDPTGESES